NSEDKPHQSLPSIIQRVKSTPTLSLRHDRIFKTKKKTLAHTHFNLADIVHHRSDKLLSLSWVK
ncbi:hypothetical protein AB8989_20070, partial [Yersinia hibernica]|uniref:hypothetical protein n=1 Tax=Yersinia hibernica TaxID=2339259 RepID=UPI003D03A102